MLIKQSKRLRLLILLTSLFLVRTIFHTQVYKTLMNSLYEDSVRRSEDLEISKGAEREKEKEKDVPLKQKSTSVSNNQGMPSVERNFIVIEIILLLNAHLVYSFLYIILYNFWAKFFSLPNNMSLGLTEMIFLIII